VEVRNQLVLGLLGTVLKALETLELFLFFNWARFYLRGLAAFFGRPSPRRNVKKIGLLSTKLRPVLAL
jgi:hypothetical protein